MLYIILGNMKLNDNNSKSFIIKIIKEGLVIIILLLFINYKIYIF